MAPTTALATTPIADAAPTGFCDPALARLAEAGEALGYTVHFDEAGLSATRDASELRCVCFDGQLTIALAEDDVSVSIDFTYEGSKFGLELAGLFPGLGSVRHASSLDGTSGRLTGSLSFAAHTADAAAFVEVDLEGEVAAAHGDAALVNHAFAPVLAGSTLWKDAHALRLALADARAPGLEIATAVAVPSPRWWGVKKSILGQAFACGGAAITCTAAAAGFLPAAGSCVNSAGGCALAVACSLTSCLD
ncbi:hypothetical protein OV203_29230 [Nannocystis sp. ILAH1]|uniref:hypothetical protein n=1 Tax=unclassified Nannocystis TaxID=2627009 RepID=UPI00226FEAC3|nr:MULTISPECIES: hypothetical protein [unclassified Nannocystis]MCY0991265.1 hypothetical protein [Nannocystis sp. ILAH1]MCY1064779.1 hypothetical protein [Nannocystis sp. RBIL2]